ncbi:MAG: hypothetical protein HY939_07165 [Gammaproteobacteria bacterium]|nr:hypothetical protein [Gammaproteobacteria bacterium]
MTTTTQHFNLRPSRQCLLLLLFIYSAPFVLVGALPWPWWSIVILECCLGYSLTRNIRRHAQLHDTASIKQLIYSKEKGWTLVSRNNLSYSVKLLPCSTVFSWLIVLNFECQDKKRHKKNILIFSDSLPPSLFRQLKVQLKYLKM